MKYEAIKLNKTKRIKNIRLPYFSNEQSIHKSSKSAFFPNYYNLFKSSPKEKCTIDSYFGKSAYHFPQVTKRKIKASSFEQFKAKAKSICKLSIHEPLLSKRDVFLKNYATLSYGSPHETVNQLGSLTSVRKCICFNKKFNLRDKIERKFRHFYLLDGNLGENTKNEGVRIMSSTPQRKIRIHFTNEYLKELIEKNNC